MMEKKFEWNVDYLRRQNELRRKISTLENKFLSFAISVLI